MEVNNSYDLRIGMVFESAAEARAFVGAYAVHNNFAVKNGVVKHKNQALLLACKCSRKPLNTRNLPMEGGATGSNGLTRQRIARSMLCACPWKVRFKKQLNDSWILTELIDEHQGHQLEGLNPLAYPENRSMTAEARHSMVDLVQHSSASVSTIASMLNTTYGLSLLGRDVYNRTYQHTQRTGNSTAKFVETLRDEGFKYRNRMASDGSLEALFFCKPEDVQNARLYGQVVIIDATYETNKFRLPLVNIVAVNNNLRTVRIALCFVTKEQAHSYIWVLRQLKEVVFSDASPDVAITDADKALMMALSQVFPTTFNQLCRWHIEQNIMKNCRKHFKTIDAFEDFMQCIKGIASSIDADEQAKQAKQLEELQNDYPTEAVSYFLQQWWVDGQYERWAEISIRKRVNFGNSTTSRVEGCHGALKVALTSSPIHQ